MYPKVSQFPAVSARICFLRSESAVCCRRRRVRLPARVSPTSTPCQWCCVGVNCSVPSAHRTAPTLLKLADRQVDTAHGPGKCGTRDEDTLPHSTVTAVLSPPSHVESAIPYRCDMSTIAACYTCQHQSPQHSKTAARLCHTRPHISPHNPISTPHLTPPTRHIATVATPPSTISNPPQRSPSLVLLTAPSSTIVNPATILLPTWRLPFPVASSSASAWSLCSRRLSVSRPTDPSSLP